jgi:hypothetical protein
MTSCMIQPLSTDSSSLPCSRLNTLALNDAVRSSCTEHVTQSVHDGNGKRRSMSCGGGKLNTNRGPLAGELVLGLCVPIAAVWLSALQLNKKHPSFGVKSPFFNPVAHKKG